MTDAEYWSLDSNAQAFVQKMQAQRAKEEKTSWQVPPFTTHAQKLLSVWWLMAWRGTVGGAVFGFLAGVIVGFLGTGPNGGTTAGLVVGLAWNLAVIQMALDKKYRGFRLAMIEN